jgi:hypothetical protein
LGIFHVTLLISSSSITSAPDVVVSAPSASPLEQAQSRSDIELAGLLEFT